MNAAHEYDELAEMAASLPGDAAEPAAAPDGLLSLIGSIDGPADLREGHDHHVRERMRERFGDPQ